MTDDNERREQGLALVQRLFAGVDTGGPGSMPAALGDYTMRHLFGDVWQQDGLTLEQRSLTTCTILIALNRESEQRLHFQAARNLGIERATLEAVITHTAYYAGWPCAVSASRVLNEVWPQSVTD